MAKALLHHFDVLKGLVDIPVGFSGLLAQIIIFTTANDNGLSLVDLEEHLLWQSTDHLAASFYHLMVL